MMRGEHCSCCEHYQKNWRVEEDAVFFKGWFVATPPTDNEFQPARYFATEAQAVEYARMCTAEPRVVFPKGRGMDFWELGDLFRFVGADGLERGRVARAERPEG